MKDKIKRNVPSNSKLDFICENDFCNVLLEHGVFDTSKRKKLIFDHELIFSSSKLNLEDCKIKTDSKLNVDFFKFMLKDYSDYEICKFLEYGFPKGFPKTVESLTLLQEFKDHKEMLKVKNHQGAVKFTKEIEKYLIKELKKGAVVGPFHENPFDHGIIIFPLNTVPKKDSLERCVILDLSAAGGTAVNESRLKEMLSAVVEWYNKQLASKREVQSLVETLNFAGSCVKPGRICISRLLNWIRSIYSDEGKVLVPEFVKKDIKWWKTFLPLFNGIFMMMKKK